MSTILLVIDPGATALTLTDQANGLRITAFDAGNADPDSIWASSVDTEGARRAHTRPLNRTITASLLIEGSTDVALQALENTVDEKIAKLNSEGGVLRLTTPAGGTLTFTVLEAVVRRSWTPVEVARHLAARELAFICLPYGVAAEQDLGDNTETVLPALVFSESVPGDVPAIGRLVVDDESGQDQWTLLYGVEDDSLYTHTASTGGGALLYECESRTVLGGAAGTAVVGASGGTVVRHTSLSTTDQAIVSTQASGGGAHLSHVGRFRVYARVQVPVANAGAVTLGFAWSVGDFRAFTRNPEVTIDEDQWVLNSAWRLVDLGLVEIPPPSNGSTQQWEGRVVARSTAAGDDVDIDYLMFIPADTASGTASAVPSFQVPTSFSALDSFDQSAGALTSKTLPVGGTWAGAGDTDDFSVNATSHVAQRTAVSDSSGVDLATGRVAIAGTATYSNIYVQVSQSFTAGGASIVWGVFARYTDANNWLAVKLATGSGSSLLAVSKNVAGTSAALASLTLGPWGIQAAEQTKAMRLQVDDQGRVWVWLWTDVPGRRPGAPILVGQDADLATGGALASGKIGFYDHYVTPTACTRTYDNFMAAVPVKDAAVFANQSLEIRDDRVIREDSAGATWQRVSSFTGHHLRVPPAGSEGRSTRVIVKAVRNDPATMPDSAIDDISAKLFVTPRYLHVPE